MYQIGRAAEFSNDFVVLDTISGHPADGPKVPSTISRFACRIIAERSDPNVCRIYAAGFDGSCNICLGEKAVKWVHGQDNESDGLTSNGVLMMNPQGAFYGGEAVFCPWREVSVGGSIYSLREFRSAQERGVPCEGETNELVDGTLINLCGATLLWRSAEGLWDSPTKSDLDDLVMLLNVAGQKEREIKLNKFIIPRKSNTYGRGKLDQPCVYLNCGHVVGYYSPNNKQICPICRTLSPTAGVCMGIEVAFFVDKEAPTHAFNPCGHIASEKTVKYWGNVDIPHGTNGFRAICPFCATPLEGNPGYLKLLYQDSLYRN